MINIQDIIRFMKDGWVAMDKNGSWVWFEQKPICRPVSYDIWRIDDGLICPLHCFDIAPADDWTKSLIKIDNTARENFEEEYQNNIQKAIQELKQDD